MKNWTKILTENNKDSALCFCNRLKVQQGHRDTEGGSQSERIYRVGLRWSVRYKWEKGGRISLTLIPSLVAVAVGGYWKVNYKSFGEQTADTLKGHTS